MLEVEPAPSGLTLLSAARVDLSARTLSSPATLSIEAPPGALGDELLVGRFLNVGGLRKLAFVGEASRSGGRFTIGGIASEATYLFFEGAEALAVVRGVVKEGGFPTLLAVVESSTSPFMDITGDDGRFTVAAALRESTITARSLVSGNTGMKSVSPASPDPITADIELLATGPFVSSATPSDLARGVDLNPVLRVEFSEPVRGVTSSSFFLRKKSGGSLVSARVALGLAGRSASLRLEGALEPRTEYELVLTTDISDLTGNALLPETIVFTTKDDRPAEFDSQEVSVSFPYPNGEVEVKAPPGAFEPEASVLLVNDTTGIVTSGEVDPEGGFAFFIRAAITDSLQIRILDSSGREIVIEKTEFRDTDGSVAIGRKGGRVEKDGFLLEVPEGALSRGAAVVRLTPVPEDVIDSLPRPEGALGQGPAVEVDTGGVTLEKEADLSFPIPSGAPADVDFLIVRKIQDGNLTLYETIDTATPRDGRLTTDSFPFPGILGPGFYMAIWYSRVLDTGRNHLGTVTGLAQESDRSPVSPQIRLLAGVRVQVERDLVDGDLMATTGSDGRFVLWDTHFGVEGASLSLVAIDSAGRRETALAVQASDTFITYPNLIRFSHAGEVVFNFDLTPSLPPPGDVTAALFRKDAEGNEVELSQGLAPLGEELFVRFTFSAPPARAQLKLNGSPLPLEKLDERLYQSRFTAEAARVHTLELDAVDAFLRPLSLRKSFLVVVSGGNNRTPVAGPPSILTDLTIPGPGNQRVPLNPIFSVAFSEPVRGVSADSVLLRSSFAGDVPLRLIGTKPDGEPLEPVGPEDSVIALTIVPTRALTLDTDYKLVFTEAIVDLVHPSTGDPEPLPLSPSPTEILYSTFHPALIGTTPTEIPAGLVVLDRLAFVAIRGFPNGYIELYDFTDPTAPEKLGLSPTFVFGTPWQMAVERGVDLGEGPRDLLAVVTNARSRQGILTVFDVSSGSTPFPWVAAVTASQIGLGGFSHGVALHQGLAYVAAGKEGLKVIDLSLAASLLRSSRLVAFEAEDVNLESLSATLDG